MDTIAVTVVPSRASCPGRGSVEMISPGFTVSLKSVCDESRVSWSGASFCCAFSGVRLTTEGIGTVFATP